MLAFFKPEVLKLVIVAASWLFFGFTGSVVTSVKNALPSIGIVRTEPGDTVDTKEEKAAASRKRSITTKDKEGKTVRISISDGGIKVDSDEGEGIILDFDIEDLERVREKLEDLPESLATTIEDLEGRRFRDVRGKDIVRFGDDIFVGRDELVRGDVVAIFGDVEIEGKVMGDVVAVLGDVDLSSDAIVNGEVVTVLGSLSREDGAMVRGESVIISPGKSPYAWELPPFGKGLFGFASRIVVFIVSLLLLGIVLAFLTDRMKRSSDYVFGAFFKSLGIGILVFLVGSIVVTIFAIILSITIVGIPVAILLVLSFIALCLMGYFVSALALGRLVANRINLASDSPYVHGFVGLFLLAVLSLLASVMFWNPFLNPFRMLLRSIGGFISLIALFTGIGAFIISKAGSISKATKPALPE